MHQWRVPDAKGETLTSHRSLGLRVLVLVATTSILTPIAAAYGAPGDSFSAGLPQSQFCCCVVPIGMLALGVTRTGVVRRRKHEDHVQ